MNSINVFYYDTFKSNCLKRNVSKEIILSSLTHLTDFLELPQPQ